MGKNLRYLLRACGFAAILLAAPLALKVTPAQASPALWVVHSSTATVYLFGTVHMLPPRVAWRSPAVDHALAESDEVWTEADTSSLPSLVRLIRRYGLSQKATLRTALPKSYRTRYATEMSSAGLNVQAYGHVKPWLAEMLLNGGTLHRARLARSVETDLLAFAHMHHKDTPTFETADQQFALLADMPMEAQVRALEIQIDGYPSAGGQMNNLVRAWLSGDDKRLDDLSNKQLVATDERYFDDVIVRRNEHFATTIVAKLQGTGVSFVAVGAAHLCGSASVQTFLKNYGYTAQRVPS